MLEIFLVEGFRRATIRGASASSVRVKDGCFIVMCVLNEVFLWIDELIWWIMCVFMYLLMCDVMVLMRIFCEF